MSGLIAIQAPTRGQIQATGDDAGYQNVAASRRAQLAPAASPIVTAAAAYAAGQMVGGLLTINNPARVGANSGLIQSVIVTCASLQTTPFDVVLFSALPAATVFTDKTALAINAADLSKVIGVARCTDVAGYAAQSVHQAQGMNMPFALAAGLSAIYAAIVTRGTPTFAAAGDVGLLVGIGQD